MTWALGALLVTVLFMAARPAAPALSVHDQALARVLAVERRARAARERQELQDAYRAGQMRLRSRPQTVAWEPGRGYVLPFAAGRR